MPQFVIEVDVRGMDGRSMFTAVDAAVQGAPVGTLVRVRVGSTRTPAWAPWLQYDLKFQFVCDTAKILDDWAALAREQVTA